MRLVSLCPSITETLIDLGLAEEIVGITRYCLRPREVTRRLPKVGGTKDPDLEAIARARPDLVFVNEEENTVAAYEALARLYRVDATFPRRVADVPAMLRHFGRLTGREAEAERRAGAVERAREDTIAAAGRGGRRFRHAYLIWRDPWMAVGGDTYVSDLLATAGGVNVFAGAATRYPEVSLAALAAEAADLVLLPDEPFRFRERHRAEVAAAVPRARVELVSGDDCCWHGIRTLDGLALVDRLCGMLDP